MQMSSFYSAVAATHSVSSDLKNKSLLFFLRRDQRGEALFDSGTHTESEDRELGETPVSYSYELYQICKVTVFF